MKNQLTLFFIFLACPVFSQKDSLQIGDRYLEDQIYFGITYNKFFNQPAKVEESSFSYGINLGYLRDIPIIKKGTVALAIGVGYSFDSFNNRSKIDELNNETAFKINTNLTSNKLTIHSIEIPLEFRWRTSTATKYGFWRIYTGIKLTYNIKNSFVYTTSTDIFTYINIDKFNKIQYGITLSAGYTAFNINLYYGLTPLLKDSNLGSTKILRLGLIFYIL